LLGRYIDLGKDGEEGKLKEGWWVEVIYSELIQEVGRFQLFLFTGIVVWRQVPSSNTTRILEEYWE
jgi:hypothetical protein